MGFIHPRFLPSSFSWFSAFYCSEAVIFILLFSLSLSLLFLRYSLPLHFDTRDHCIISIWVQWDDDVGRSSGNTRFEWDFFPAIKTLLEIKFIPRLSERKRKRKKEKERVATTFSQDFFFLPFITEYVTDIILIPLHHFLECFPDFQSQEKGRKLILERDLINKIALIHSYADRQTGREGEGEKEREKKEKRKASEMVFFPDSQIPTQ